MLPILQNQSAPTMTSEEIASLVNSRHDTVKKSIERLAKSGAISHPPLVDGIRAANGTVPRFYLINKRDSYVIVAQLSPEFTAVLVDRWQELESQQAPKHILPQTFAEALQLAANQAVELEAARPAVAFVERYVQSTGNLGFRQVCKLLKAKEPVFRQFLEDNRIMYKLAGDWTPYSQHISAGRFNVNTGIGNNEHSYTEAKFTPKGVSWINKLWMSKELNDFIIRDMNKDSE